MGGARSEGAEQCAVGAASEPETWTHLSRGAWRGRGLGGGRGGAWSGGAWSGRGLELGGRRPEAPPRGLGASARPIRWRSAWIRAKEMGAGPEPNMAGRAGPEAEGGGQVVPRLGLGGRRGRPPQAEAASGAPGAALRQRPFLERDPVLRLAGSDLAAPSPRPGSNGGSCSGDPAPASS